VHSTTTTFNKKLVLSSLKVIKNIVSRKRCLFTHKIIIRLSHTNLFANFFRIRNFFLGRVTAEWIFNLIFLLILSLLLRIILSVLNIKLTFSLYFTFLLINSSKIRAWFHSFGHLITLLTACKLTFFHYTILKFFRPKLTFWRQKIIFHCHILF
jgi:hypothetical protein